MISVGRTPQLHAGQTSFPNKTTTSMQVPHFSRIVALIREAAERLSP
jgi:hypothetical protein